jgi:hypothetical protein
VDQRLGSDRLSVRASADAHGGSFTAWTAGAGLAWRSSVRHEGRVLLAAAGLEAASARAPRALWPGAGAGHARRPLLRAHPLLDDGRIAGPVFGRRVRHATVEFRHWLAPVARVLRVAPALFVDAAHATRRLDAGDAWQVDAGIGLRLAAPGSGVLRVDLARGLRDGAMQVSAGWVRGFD